MVRHTEKAFKWIISLLQARKIPFVIFGGLAAKGYGAGRSLADIDIAIPEERFGEIYYNYIKYAFWGPDTYKDENWDIFLVSLEYEGQEIDLCATRYKIFDKRLGKWVSKERDLGLFNTVEFYGLHVPVIAKSSLFEEKLQLGRKADKEDVSDLCANNGDAQEFLTEIKNLHLPKGKYAVFGSGPMVVRSMRKSGDVDIIVLPSLYHQCLHSGWEERKSGNTLKLVKGNVEMYRDWNFPSFRPDVKKLISTAEYIGGVPFVLLPEVIKWKQVFGREKDVSDVKQIEEYLKIANLGVPAN